MVEGGLLFQKGSVPEVTRAQTLLREACGYLREEHPWSGNSKCKGPGVGVRLVRLECRRQAGTGVPRTVRKGKASFDLKGMGGQVGSVGHSSGLLLAGESSSKWNSYRGPAGVQLWVVAAGQPLTSVTFWDRLISSDGPLPVETEMETGHLLCRQSQSQDQSSDTTGRLRFSQVWIHRSVVVL